MIFTETPLKGAFLVSLEKREDARGFFARTFCQKEFEVRGLNPRVAQCNISVSLYKGTLRGMHYQVPPFAEAKLIRCLRGAIYDVIIDLRSGSASYAKHYAATLSANDPTMLFVPEGLAHGFQTLEDDTEVFYQMSESYAPDCARGVRWDDPAFGISWPPANRIILDRDRNYPLFSPEIQVRT